MFQIALTDLSKAIAQVFIMLRLVSSNNLHTLF